MTDRHIVRSYDQELDTLRTTIADMGWLAERQLTLAVEALNRHDHDLAREIIIEDDRINALEKDVDRLTVQLLARRQPLASDLRVVLASLKIAAELERAADYAANIAKHVRRLNRPPHEGVLQIIGRMGESALTMLRDVLKAYRDLDTGLAVRVWHRDDDIDEAYHRVLERLRETMAQDPDGIEDCSTLLFVARCCERIGDHLTNVAENVVAIVTGEPYPPAD